MSQIDRDTMMAYLDDQLDAASRAAVETHLAAHPEAAAEIAALRRQADTIRTLYAPAGAEPVPARLDPHRLAVMHHRRRMQTFARTAMILAVLGIGVVAGWLLRPPAEAPRLTDRLIADAVSAHTVYVAENRHAVEVAGAEAEHLSSWLSNRLATELAMPDLSGQGLAFLGGRLLPSPASPGGRAAQLMYENATGERVTLYITPAAGIAGPTREEVRLGGDTILYWANPVITCTIVGPQPPAALQSLADSVFAQLTPGDLTPGYRDL